jgi:hypothetical protein
MPCGITFATIELKGIAGMGDLKSTTFIQDSDAWLSTHFKETANESKRLFHLVLLTTNGISVLVTLPRFGELIKLRAVSEQDHDLANSLMDHGGISDLAQLEISEGYPITYSQYVVDIWGLLEASVRNLASKWLEQKPEIMQTEAIKKLKIQLGEYEQCAGSARYQYIVKTLERDQSSSLKKGAERFESILSAVGLGGSIPKKLRDALFEMSQLRNCIVHNARKADDQLISQCPWLNLQKDQRISLKFEEIDKFRRTFLDYTILLFGRGLKVMGYGAGEEIIDEVFQNWT